ncbi:nucleotidyltransferase domain-containing protein [Thiorhodococcus minor]
MIDAWLFGTQARETAGGDSDADIAVLLRGGQGAPGTCVDAAVGGRVG